MKNLVVRDRMLLDLHRSCKSVLKPGHIRCEFGTQETYTSGSFFCFSTRANICSLHFLDFRLKMKMIGFFALGEFLADYFGVNCQPLTRLCTWFCSELFIISK